MATVNRRLVPPLSPKGEAFRHVDLGGPAGLLRCLMLVESPQRRHLMRMAAEAQAWEAIVCRDAAELLRASFTHAAPLVVVDLPSAASSEYAATRQAVEHAKQSSNALIAVCGLEDNEDEERWVRSLGVWAYFCEASRSEQMRHIFHEARMALGRQESLKRREL